MTKNAEEFLLMTTFPVLETERLLLRNVTEEDAPHILSYLSDEEVMKYYGLDPFQTLEEALDEISWYQSIFKNKTGIRWGITLKEQGEMIGSCGFHNRVPQHYRSEIGFELSKAHWGQKIAGEAINAIVRYGFEQMEIHRIEALIEPLNLPSQKLVEKQGFVREGLLRNYEFTRGKFDDLYMYSLLKTDVENTAI